mgnify:CR=1 FL=1
MYLVSHLTSDSKFSLPILLDIQPRYAVNLISGPCLVPISGVGEETTLILTEQKLE